MTLTYLKPKFQGHQSFPSSIAQKLRYNYIAQSAYLYPSVTAWHSDICYRKSVCLLSDCLSVRLPLMFVHPTQGVETFCNISCQIAKRSILEKQDEVLGFAWRNTGKKWNNRKGVSTPEAQRDSHSRSRTNRLSQTTSIQTRAHQEMRYPNVTWRIILYVYLFTTELRHTCSSRIYF